MKQQLTKEQSIELFDMGIPASAATGSFIEEPSGDTHSWTYPVFTIGDLCEVLPKSIDNDPYHTLAIMYVWDEWEVHYNYAEIEKICGKELVDTLYAAVIWCIDNGHIKTGTK